MSYKGVIANIQIKINIRMMNEKENEKIIYPELSYKIIGFAFNVYNEVGFGLQEKYYQRMLMIEFEKKNICYKKEYFVKLKYQDKIIGNYKLDFLVDNKIIVELKVKPKIGYTHVKQVLAYLKATNLKLAIIIYFTKEGVKYRRILNTY